MKRFVSDTGGVVAIEFALSAGLLLTLLMGVADIGNYLHRRMQVDGAAFAVARAIFAGCGPKSLPALDKCAGLDAIVADAAKNSSIGARGAVVLDEAYYCVDSSGRLARVAERAKKPAKCAGKSGLPPGDFVRVTLSHRYQPLFLGSGIVDLLPVTITRTAMAQLE